MGESQNGWISGVQTAVNFTHYRHGEFDGEEVGTQFKNDQFNYRVTLDQRKYKRLSGNLGFSGIKRSFSSLGEEALAPPTEQISFSLFGLQKLDFERLSLQFGGRFEHNGYTVDQTFSPPRPSRTFDGASQQSALGFRSGRAARL
jgi:iron complex outermembrane recepter protein